MTIHSTIKNYADEAIRYYHNDSNIPEITQEQLVEISAETIADYIEYDFRDLYKNGNLSAAIPSLDDLEHDVYENETTLIYDILPDLAEMIADRF